MSDGLNDMRCRYCGHAVGHEKGCPYPTITSIEDGEAVQEWAKRQWARAEQSEAEAEELRMDKRSTEQALVFAVEERERLLKQLETLRTVLGDSRHDAEEPYAYFVRELREERRNCVMCGGCEAVLHTEHVVEHNADRDAEEPIECPACRAQYEMYWLRCLD